MLFGRQTQSLIMLFKEHLFNIIFHQSYIYVISSLRINLLNDYFCPQEGSKEQLSSCITYPPRNKTSITVYYTLLNVRAANLDFH